MVFVDSGANLLESCLLNHSDRGVIPRRDFREDLGRTRFERFVKEQS